MGSCSVVMNGDVLRKITNEEPYTSLVTITDFCPFSDTTYQVYLITDLLPQGYQGQQEMAFVDGSLKFKKEHDV